MRSVDPPIAEAEGHTVVTANNGNFYTGKVITFPVTVRASQCPADATMPTQPQVGDCNSCHGTASRIHLP